WAWRVTERNGQGKVLWEKQLKDHPVSCERLANGHTFIATLTELLEVNREGQTVFSIEKPDHIYCAQKLPNGHILYARPAGLVELDPTGKEIFTLASPGMGSWGGVELLPNGRFLVAKCDANRVVEMDAAGKEYWECTVTNPAYASRLTNGNTLV